jgi:NitT/TauT family transport system ATP-binding protein
VVASILNRAADSEAAIIGTKVSKTFGTGTHALDAVSFNVAHGEFVAVLGPSGCGKSTLLRIIGGLIAPDPGGAVSVGGQVVRQPKPEVGVVFQSHNLLPWLTVEKNIRLAAEIRRADRATLDQRTRDMVKLLRLEGFEQRYPHELSGGMQQRTAIGQTLILNPSVLLMDEPFGALDALTRDHLNVELLRIWQAQRQTVILVTHSIVEAVFLADRVLVMSDRPGRIIEDFRVDIPRPREPQSTKGLPEFARSVLHLSRLMGVG